MTAPARMMRSPLPQPTSRDAFRTRPMSPVDAQILAVIEQNDGACDHEIESWTGLRHQTVSANRRHLVERGEVHASDERRPSPSGRAAIVWKRGRGAHQAPTLHAITDQLEMLGVRP